jgi:hypothetical protein
MKTVWGTGQNLPRRMDNPPSERKRAVVFQGCRTPKRKKTPNCWVRIWWVREDHHLLVAHWPMQMNISISLQSPLSTTKVVLDDKCLQTAVALSLLAAVPLPALMAVHARHYSSSSRKHHLLLIAACCVCHQTQVCAGCTNWTELLRNQISSWTGPLLVRMPVDLCNTLHRMRLASTFIALS